MSKFLCVRCVFSLLRRPSIHSSPQIFVLDNQESLKSSFFSGRVPIMLYFTTLTSDSSTTAGLCEAKIIIMMRKYTKYQCTQLLRSFSLSVFLLSLSHSCALLFLNLSSPSSSPVVQGRGSWRPLTTSRLSGSSRRTMLPW